MNCDNTDQNTENTAEIAASETTEPEEQETDVPVGDISMNDLQQKPHMNWFDPMYQSYKPNAEALETIENNINEYKIKLFMGTWCADSKREVPKFYKLLELSDYDLSNLEMKAVTLNKTLPDDLHIEYDIHHVPTIIFYKDGEEAGRFVEYPQEDFEEDIAKIVSGQEYQHSYDYE